MDGTLTDEATSVAVRPDVADEFSAPLSPAPLSPSRPLSVDPALADPAVAEALVAELDHPNLVFSDGYVGPDRRGTGRLARVRRVVFAQRRSVLRLELVVVAAVAVLALAAVATAPSGAARISAAGTRTPLRHGVGSLPAGRSTAAAPASTAQSSATQATVPVTTVPVSAATPAAAAPAAAIPAATTATTTLATVPPAAAPQTASTATLTPDQMGAQALALVRYPWQKIPGYTIQFLPISDAPSAGFYGNTTFTWGKVGGTSVMYVYPGETVERLAGITAFEIGHEVDAAAVQPEGGEAQIENSLGIHPASWAPNCDCAEQGFLSGWYSATFSNYWSPGVGNWSTVAPSPTGAVLAAVEPWLNPVIP